MNKKKSGKNNIPIRAMLFVLDFFLLILAANVDRICYISFLKKNGYGLKDIFVPWKIFVKYHTSGIGLFLAIVIAILMIAPVLIFLTSFLKKNGKDSA